MTSAVLDALESPRVQEALREGDLDSAAPRRAELLAEIGSLPSCRAYGFKGARSAPRAWRRVTRVRGPAGELRSAHSRGGREAPAGNWATATRSPSPRTTA